MRIHTVFPHIVSAETILFLNLEIQRSQYIRPKVTVHKCAETIQGRKLFKGGNYRRKYGIKRGKYAFFAGYSIIDGYEVCFKFLLQFGGFKMKLTV